MKRLFIDIETFSSVNLKTAGLYKYAQSPDFQVMLLACSQDGAPVELIDFMAGDNLEAWAEIKTALADPGVEKHAYNAAFEWYCLNRITPSPLEGWRCTMVHGLYCGCPAGLAAVSAALGLPEDKRKLSVGAALIRTFCTPQTPGKSNGGRARTLPRHEPEKWALFRNYCRQDVAAEMAVEAALSAWPLPEKEQRLWQFDIAMNAYGALLDRELVESAIYCDAATEETLTAEARRLSGLDNPNSAAQLAGWLRDQGVETANLQKATVKSLVGTVDNPTARRMLEIRQETAKTSVKKYYTMREVVGEDGRARGLLQFYGANRTGRWGGRFIQPQNLPRSNLETLDFARVLVKAKKLDALKIIYGNVPDALSQLVRTAFIPPPGKLLAVADFSAIEARIIAWLAGETWRTEVFATHGKIYEASAAAMFGVPLEKIVKGQPEYALRQKGKIAELALGYQGGPSALVAMGALEMGLKEDELPEIVGRWRNSNKRIVALWSALEEAAVEVMQSGRPANVRGLILAHEMDMASSLDSLTVALPSGRKLFYAKPFLASNKWGWPSLHYYGVGQNNKWATQETYGGKLVENCVQAIARDCLAESLLRLSMRYKIVFHVHDEAVLEVDGAGDLEWILSAMAEPLPWAQGLNLKADGFVCKFYCKN